MTSRRPLKPADPVDAAKPQDDVGAGSVGNGDDNDLLSPGSGEKMLPPAQATGAKNKRKQAGTATAAGGSAPVQAKRPRTNTPWTAAEELRLKNMRDAGNSWSEIAKTFPTRTEGSVKKHWYKDMHYAEFGEDESAALLAAIREYDANKWKVIGQKVGKPAKACEQYAKEHFSK